MSVDSVDCGSTEKPCKTIQNALSKCRDDINYVCHLYIDGGTIDNTFVYIVDASNNAIESNKSMAGLEIKALSQVQPIIACNGSAGSNGGREHGDCQMLIRIIRVKTAISGMHFKSFTAVSSQLLLLIDSDDQHYYDDVSFSFNDSVLEKLNATTLLREDFSYT